MCALVRGYSAWEIGTYIHLGDLWFWLFVHKLVVLSSVWVYVCNSRAVAYCVFIPRSLFCYEVILLVNLSGFVHASRLQSDGTPMFSTSLQVTSFVHDLLYCLCYSVSKWTRSFVSVGIWDLWFNGLRSIYAANPPGKENNRSLRMHLFAFSFFHSR